MPTPAPDISVIQTIVNNYGTTINFVNTEKNADNRIVPDNKLVTGPGFPGAIVLSNLPRIIFKLRRKMVELTTCGKAVLASGETRTASR
jgi:hypothetical protein